MGWALVGAVAVLPYALALTPLPPLPAEAPPFGTLLALSVLQGMILLGIAAGIGLWLGPGVGLGAPLLAAWVAGDPQAPRRFRSQLPLAIGLGISVGGVIVALDVALFTPNIPALGALGNTSQGQFGPPALGLLASLYGAIDEEILLRLGVMTLLAWLGSLISRQRPPGAAVMWGASLLAALLFGLGHLRATAALLPLTPLVILRALVLNGLAGIAFGWLYWRQSLLAAMASHFCADIVLHVLTPLLAPLVLGHG